MSTSTRFDVQGRTSAYVALAVAMLVGLVLAWLFVGGQGDQNVAASETVLAQSDGDTDETDESEALDIATLDVTFEAFLGRDPFESIRPPEPDPPASDPTNGDPSTGDPSPTDPSTGQPTPVSPSPGDPTNGDPNTGQVMIQLIEVTDTGARIQVGSTVYAPSVGDVFGDELRLVRIIDDCVELQQGDQLLPILCEGQATAK